MSERDRGVCSYETVNGEMFEISCETFTGWAITYNGWFLLVLGFMVFCVFLLGVLVSDSIFNGIKKRRERRQAWQTFIEMYRERQNVDGTLDQAKSRMHEATGRRW